MAYLRYLSLAILMTATGCSTGGSTGVDSWVSARGGLVAGQISERASAAVHRLPQEPKANLTIQVLDCDRPLAYAWPDGRIFVTRGLVESLTDDELSAAIAHEVGHLLADPSPTRDVALAGASDHHDAAEVAADLAGRRLLTVSGIDGSVMVTMLQKVAAHPQTPATTRQALLFRARLLRHAPAR